MARKEESVWNRLSSVYDFFMKKDEATYKEIIQRTTQLLKPKEHVLEIATGTGIIALGLCEHILNIEAIDFSTDMIAVARKKAAQMGANSLKFDVQDACKLTYDSGSFDAVMIANALHVMPNPDMVLMEIKRVLTPEGRLIAPTFVHAESLKAEALSRLMRITGFRAYHKWTEQSYHKFLNENSFEIVESRIFQASFPLNYVVAKPIKTDILG
ncbi:demethylmenaquinone methyltransferase [Anaerotignum neopropionicum]|uniref:Demethylmenaquinone methyltransferase n=1 Tax=Anaerotignum neopropionicum TaxID=36847 RepID=A0A136WD05_9FIRM|nr:class I SAM-dependent methyltransferase [Anaerotignum neopropionicum]KXL52219.1 demethylmenaquinone methyltransferase [Anaerotignum neopropionicum]